MTSSAAVAKHHVLPTSIAIALGLLIAMMAVACAGCCPPSACKRSTGTQVQIGHEAVFAFAQESEIHLYEDGRDHVIGHNPAGYDSLDYWFGYSPTLGGVIFYRSFDKCIRLLQIDRAHGRLGTRSFSSSYYPDFNPNEVSLCGSVLCQIRGGDRQVELWSSQIDGKWKKEHSWTLPNSVPVPSQWRASVDIHDGICVFQTPSYYVMSCSEERAEASVLSKGDSRWHSPGVGDISLGIPPVPPISPDGKCAVYRQLSNPDHRLTIGVVPLHGGTARTVVIWKPGDALCEGAFTMPTEVVGFQWLPDGKAVATEVITDESGHSSVFVTDMNKNVSSSLPFWVERYQWCVISRSIE